MRARFTILAAGANATTLAAFGLAGPKKPEAVAGRAYYEAPPDLGQPGLLAAGEALATTYSATGEGIGKAMESGILAPEMIGEPLRGTRNTDGLEHAYQAEFETRFLGRYRAYRPTLLNLLARRANAGTFLQAELEALVAERGEAGNLFSATGLFKALVC